jgi:hypothetical protein
MYSQTLISSMEVFHVKLSYMSKSSIKHFICGIIVMVFSITSNNISVVLWWLVLLVEQTSSTRSQPVKSHKKLYYIKLYQVQLQLLYHNSPYFNNQITLNVHILLKTAIIL